MPLSSWIIKRSCKCDTVSLFWVMNACLVLFGVQFHWNGFWCATTVKWFQHELHVVCWQESALQRCHLQGCLPAFRNQFKLKHKFVPDLQVNPIWSRIVKHNFKHNESWFRPAPCITFRRVSAALLVSFLFTGLAVAVYFPPGSGWNAASLPSQHAVQNLWSFAETARSKASWHKMASRVTELIWIFKMCQRCFFNLQDPSGCTLGFNDLMI